MILNKCWSKRTKDVGRSSKLDLSELLNYTYISCFDQYETSCRQVIGDSASIENLEAGVCEEAWTRTEGKDRNWTKRALGWEKKQKQGNEQKRSSPASCSMTLSIATIDWVELDAARPASCSMTLSIPTIEWLQ